ncbi:MAG: EAL domain-containing protein [Bilifractor sp.]
MHTAYSEFTAEERQLLEEMPIAMGMYRFLDGHIIPVFVNKGFVHLFGCDTREQALETLRKNIYTGIHPDDVAGLSDGVARLLREEGRLDVVYRVMYPGQRGYHVVHAIGQVLIRKGVSFYLISYMEENGQGAGCAEQRVVEKQNSESVLRPDEEHRRDGYDALTGLPNAGWFFRVADEQIRGMQEKGKNPVVVWIDYHGLKDYDKMHGFSAGDALIKDLGSRIRMYFGQDRAARFSSDHFLVLSEEEGLEERLQKLFEDVRMLHHGNSLAVHAGIYRFSFQAVNAASACDRARAACDTLRTSGQSGYAVFDRRMIENERMSAYIFQNFQRAMAEGWIQVYYQPVVRTVTGMLCGAEALCRWIDPQMGTISPGQFIPMLEEHGLIYQLDLYMVEQVCRDYQALVQARRAMVPVSVNLSRKDFIKSDLVNQIENIAQKYRVPREVLNLEITESAFIQHQEKLNYMIGLFHELGFQVWMDDFGTAYSSLGSLKDLSFDELKIDMSFLSSSTDRARSIVRSVVRMAKEIGVQTLAEGVETQEQYEFLRRIGCEKVQGYLCGKPMDKHTFDQYMLDHHVESEQLRCRSYYDALSRIDYQSSQPLCVLEDDGVTLKNIFTNEAYNEVLRRDGLDGIESWLDSINLPGTPVHAVHRQFNNEQLRKHSGIQTMTYPSGDHYMELSGRTVTHYENRYIYACTLRRISLNPNPEHQKNDDFLRNLYYICNDIAIIDLEKQTLYGLKSSNSDLPIGGGGKEVDLHHALDDWGNRFVYFMDYDRYERFVDLSTLRSRLLHNDRQMLTDVFRSRTQNGEYQWMLHILMLIPKTGGKKILDVSICPGMDYQRVREVMQKSTILSAEEKSGDAVEDGISGSLLWINLEKRGTDMYFWKDMDRRFLGASQSFLDYYGFDSVQEIIGKTDEDMRWHVETEPFKSDELRVLQKGESVSFALGKCIARGWQRNILANKVPIYRNGKIVGLLGKFIDADDLLDRLNASRRAEYLDPVTEIANSSGFMESLRSYLEELWTKGTEFYIIKLYNPEFDIFLENYGTEAGKRILRQVGRILRETAGSKAVIARLTGSYFFILMQDTEPEIIERFTAEIRHRLGKMLKVGELQCAVSLHFEISHLNAENASEKKYVDVLAQIMDSFGAVRVEPGSAGNRM